MDELMVRYIDYIKASNLSLNTIDAYKRDINQFKDFLNTNKLLFLNVDSVIIMSYIHHLIECGKKQSSIARNIVCLRNFYKFLIKFDYINKAPNIDYETPKVERPVPHILTVDEVILLLSTPDTKTVKGVRDKAMLEMMYATGMKITEMLNLTIENVNLDLSCLSCTGSKGMERIILLGKYSVQWLEKYLGVRKEFDFCSSKTLFLNTKGEKMTRQGFWKIIKYYAEKSGIKKDINPNTLRHSIAVHLIENGADMRLLKEQLGYKDISTIQVYMDIIKRKKLIEVYNNTHPRA